MPNNAISVDHVIRRQDGGDSVPGNAEVRHPYCNTGYKEKVVHLARVASTAASEQVAELAAARLAELDDMDREETRTGPGAEATEATGPEAPTPAVEPRVR